MLWKGKSSRVAVPTNDAIHSVGQSSGELSACEDVLARAMELERSGRRDEALRAIREAINRGPVTAELVLAMGSIYHLWSRYIEAHHVLAVVLQRFPDNINVLARLAWAAHAIGKVAEAESLMRRLVEQRPREADAHYGLGVVLRSQKRFEQAIDEFRVVIERDPSAVHAYINLGVSLMDLGRFDEAEIPLRKALTLSPGDAGCWSNLGVNLHRQGRDGAEDAYLRALELENASGKSVDAFVNYASFLRNVGRIAESIAVYRKYLPEHPSTSGLTQLGMCMLHVGDYGAGWSLYEFRWLQEPLVSLRANLDTPTWQGQDLANKSILIRAEQGVGDVVQFARFLPAIKQLGANVLFQGRDGMEELTNRFLGVDKVINTGEPLPHFDYYTNLMSLPRYFGEDPARFPAAEKYIQIDAGAASAFRARLDPEELSVGIVWAGNPTHQQDKQRSMPLGALETLAGLPGVRLVSLQKGDAGNRLQDSGVADRIFDWAPLLLNFGDTADAVAALDAVISVDTSVAHIAGALGRKLWVALPVPAEWRWMDDREDSGWYPCARLIRQHKQGDWTEVTRKLIAEVTLFRDKGTYKRLRDQRDLKSEADPESIAKPAFHPPHIPSDLPSIGEMREGIFEYLQRAEDKESLSLAWYGEWHHEQMALLARLVKLDQTVVEVGSSIGVHAVALSRLVGPGGHMLVFENDLKTRRILGENLRANRARNVTVMQTVCGVDAAKTSPGSFDTIDSIELERLDWLKVNQWQDLDAVLTGADNTLWRSRPKLFVNVESDFSAAASRIAAYGYTCWLHRSPVFRSQNFNKLERPMSQHYDQLAILAIPEEVLVDVDISPCEKIAL
jgi:tetratricopeptide (TPR) repeat protein